MMVANVLGLIDAPMYLKLPVEIPRVVTTAAKAPCQDAGLVGAGDV